MITETIHSLKRVVCLVACILMIAPYFAMAGFTLPAEETDTEGTIEVPDLGITDAPVEPDVDLDIPKAELPTLDSEPDIPEEEEPEHDVVYYDIPLSESLQEHIFTLCEQYHVAPSLIISIIFRESCFKENAVGDSGNSLGLMQIQPRWFQKEMAAFGITNCGEGCAHKTCLRNPYQNTLLGIDFVAKLAAKGNSIEWILMAYNGGESYANRMAAQGKISDYARDVLSYSESLGG